MARIMVFGPHPDDQELGMGGTIVRFAEQGHDILLVDITSGEPTPHGSPEQREIEWNAATTILDGGTGRVTRTMIGLPNRSVEHTLEARHKVAGVIRTFAADILFVPYEQDAHPDHRATTRVVEDARFDAKLTKIDLPGEPIYPKWLFYYYCTHLRWVADPSFCIDITGQIETKIESIKAYETQFVIPEKNRRVVEWVRQMNGYIGSRIGTEYAEPFFTKEPLGLSGLDAVVM
ncbi:PIG-L family deacetylase [Mucisphaera calidilacus]|uniref:Glucosamine-6-phosphate deaminase-like protein n=1 Tax=Mucisphaera calidilacus TaxID=2527982 RepID=A0A518BW88_9BACT|nr:PIG-L family deacetylase [Mucisphaera calidilacus]QDU71238.1 glucosamine-6-phosphate deaminase-like protein [Mucisphaera calidilacus]